MGISYRVLMKEVCFSSVVYGPWIFLSRLCFSFSQHTFHQTNVFRCICSLERSNKKKVLETAVMRPLQSSALSLSLCIICASADSAGGRPAGGGRWRALRRGQHAGGGTQDAGSGAGEGITEAQQAGYPGDLWRRHPAAGENIFSSKMKVARVITRGSW